jgi:hypothetical protein
MTSLRDQLRRKWNEAVNTSTAGHEWRGVVLDVSGPVRFVAAVREPDTRIALLVEAPLNVAPASLYRVDADGLSVTDQRRPEEGLLRIAIALEDDAVRDVFEVLTGDIIEVACRTSTAKDAVIETVRRLEAWRACLKARRLGLSKEGQIGLIGELIVLRILAAEMGYSAAVRAWHGPLEGIHDFNRAGNAIEVKTVAGTGSWLQISRLTQLETEGLSTLVVARPRLQESASGSSLAELVKQIRESIDRDDPATLVEFNERMIRAGYLEINAEMYSTLRFALHDIRWYEVARDFPRLTTSNIPAGIVDGTYVIDERSIVSFQVDQQAVRRLFKAMKEAAHA